MANAFYIQEEWITDYKLSGNDLLIFARLASFTLNIGGYNGSVEWLGHSVGTTKRTATNVLRNLEDAGLIERGDRMIKCVFQPISRGEKNSPKRENISPNGEKIAREKISPNSAKFSQEREKISPKYYKEINTPIKCSDSVIVEETTHTLTHTENFLFDFFKSKIQNEMDESCIRNLAKKFANIEQAKLFAEFCEERKTNLNLGMICKLHGEIFDKACEWDAQGRPRKHQKQPEIAHQPQVQMLPPQETPENSAKEAEIRNFNQWRGQVIDCIKNNPKFAKKTLIQLMRITTQVIDQFPTPCDIEVIKDYLNTAI